MFKRLFRRSQIVVHKAQNGAIEPSANDVGVSPLLKPYAEETFGEASNVLHELASDGLHIDIYVVPHSKQGDHITLITSGMSERPMKAPRGQERFRYAELIMCPPPDWPLEGPELENEEYYWPIRCLKTLARFPHQHNTWFGAGHTIPNGNPPRPYAPNTELCCALLSPMVFKGGGFPRLRFENGWWIDFLQVIPIHKAEMEYTLKRGYKTFVPRMYQSGTLWAIDPSRKVTSGIL